MSQERPKWRGFEPVKFDQRVYKFNFVQLLINLSKDAKKVIMSYAY